MPQDTLNMTQPVLAAQAISANKGYEDAISNIFSKYPILSKLGTKDDFKIIPATGDAKNYLQRNKFGLEFLKKGDAGINDSEDLGKGFAAGDKNHYRAVIDTTNKTPQQIEEQSGLDFVSHALHDLPAYNSFANDLKQKLYAKYGQKMVESNDGVDGYIRGYLSNAPEYKPFKDEMSFLPNGYFDTLDNIIKGGGSSNTTIANPILQNILPSDATRVAKPILNK